MISISTSLKTILSYSAVALAAYYGTIVLYPKDRRKNRIEIDDVKTLRGGSSDKALKEFLLNKAIRRRAVKVAIVATMTQYVIQNYNSAVIKAVAASLPNLKYSSEGRALYQHFIDKHFIQKVNPYSNLNSAFPFVNKITRRIHLRIIKKHIAKLLRLGVPNGKIKALLILLFLLWYLLTQGLIPYTAGVAALAEYCSDEGLEESVADALIEVFIVGPEAFILSV